MSVRESNGQRFFADDVNVCVASVSIHTYGWMVHNYWLAGRAVYRAEPRHFFLYQIIYLYRVGQTRADISVGPQTFLVMRRDKTFPQTLRGVWSANDGSYLYFCRQATVSRWEILTRISAEGDEANTLQMINLPPATATSSSR